MNEAIFEELLNEVEGSTLDFKRDQYPFVSASDEAKSELLKDIIAFANAWRRTTAFILIGVEEVKGGRSNPIGIAEHLNDDDLQQFVNTKTNRPVAFAYRAFQYQGAQIGIIEIPLQERPVYATKNFGRVAKETVLLRRGSSTAVASPTEIASMGCCSRLRRENAQL